VLALDSLDSVHLAAPYLEVAFALLRGVRGVVLDLRRNGGGDPVQVAWWMSHFFPAGARVHLNDIYNRPNDATESFFTDPAAPVHYAGAVYVLTSKRTFSGGEECAYDFQTQKRGTLVGEATGGGANPGERFPLVQGFVAFVPTGRAINPVTKTNWEHAGVQPDVVVPAVDALKTAHVALLREAIAATGDPQRKQRLGEVLADVSAGRTPAP
jgi:C-terminal processing protease CtpA/Prc